jgi:hypothetical protein
MSDTSKITGVVNCLYVNRRRVRLQYLDGGVYVLENFFLSEDLPRSIQMGDKVTLEELIDGVWHKVTVHAPSRSFRY